jgi:hypothetical protein
MLRLSPNCDGKFVGRSICTLYNFDSFAWRKVVVKQNRRSFILGAASLVVVPSLPIALMRPVKAADPLLLYEADMEVSDFREYALDGGPSGKELHSSGNSPIISPKRARIGDRSLEVYLNRETSERSYRTEVSTGPDALDFFKEYWIGFSIYIPSDWQVSSSRTVLFQIHDTPKDWSIGLNPIFAISEIENSDNWYIRQRYMTEPEGEHTKDDQVTAFSDLYGTIERGAWTDWVIQYRPDYRKNSSGGNGVTRVWRNGQQIIDYKGPNAYNQSQGPYIKFGCYKSAWKNRDLNDPVKERLYYFDEFRVSKADEGSYAYVVPGDERETTSTPTTRPNPPQILSVG